MCGEETFEDGGLNLEDLHMHLYFLLNLSCCSSYI